MGKSENQLLTLFGILIIIIILSKSFEQLQSLMTSIIILAGAAILIYIIRGR